MKKPFTISDEIHANRHNNECKYSAPGKYGLINQAYETELTKYGFLRVTKAKQKIS